MKRTKPKLRLKIDIREDVANAQDIFWFKATNNRMATWFFPSNFQYILSKKFTKKERAKIIAEYCVNFYKVNKKEIAAGLSRCENNGRKKEGNSLKL